MPNFWECILDACIEGELGVPSSSTNITIYDLVRWGNKAQDIIANKTNCIEKLVTFNSVANQMEYTPDTSFIRPIHADFMTGLNTIVPLKCMDIIRFRSYENNAISSNQPALLTVFANKLRIFPTVTASAGNTTANGSHSATTSTITVVSTADFPTRGRAKVLLEKFDYTGKTPTTFTGCTRGVEGTTAATFTTADAVTECDLSVWANVRYKTRAPSVYTTGTALFTNGSATVAGTSTTWVGNVFPGDLIGTGTNPNKWYEVSTVSASSIVLTSTFGETTTTSTSYVATSPLDIPAEHSELITLYLLFRIKKKLEIEPTATQYENEFNSKIAEAHTDMLYNNSTSYPSVVDEDDMFNY